MKNSLKKARVKTKPKNEMGQRKDEDRRATVDSSKMPVAERRKANRRRQIDPTTCEREYSEPEIEFMHAMDEYKRLSGRMFPTCSEILEVILRLGYRKVAEAQSLYQPAEVAV